MNEEICEHTEDDNDLGFTCESDICPVHLANQQEMRRYARICSPAYLASYDAQEEMLADLELMHSEFHVI